jgi:cysteine desulfurase/selenocysteine lyase
MLKLDVDRDIERIREDFPILKHKTWFATAGHGPLLYPVWEAVKACWGFTQHDARADPPDVKAEATRLLKADPEEICWINRVSQGLNIVSSMMDLKKGENVVTTDLAYPSNVFVWFPFREKGVEIKLVRNRGGQIMESDFEKVVDDDTKVVSISSTEWVGGTTYDLKELARIAHDHGALLVVDSYQAVGAVDIDCHATDIDFMVTGSGKWLCCPTSSGIFYIRKDHIDEFDPAYRLYGHVEEAFRDGASWVRPPHDNIATYDKPLVATAAKFDRGCVGRADLWGLHAALKYFNDLGIGNIERRNRRLSGYLIDGLVDQGCNVLTPKEPERRAGLVAYSAGSPEVDKRINDGLEARNVLVYLRYSGGVGGIRAATHFFNTEVEIDKLLSLQKKLMK